MVNAICCYSIMIFIIMHLIRIITSQFLPPSAFQNPSMFGAMSPMGNPMMPSPMQIPLSFHQQRLPIVVMPFHSKAADQKYNVRKKRRPKKFYTDSGSTSDSNSECSSSSNEYLRISKHKNGIRKKKRQLLIPVISYVTRDGRVVYQKRIKKENAGDWLEIGKKKIPSKLIEEDEKRSGEITIRDLKNKYGIRHSHHSHDD